MIPILTTARCRLRPFTPDDIAGHAAIWSDPRVTAHVGGKPRNREDSWLRMLAITGHWEWFGYGFWAVEKDGRLIGNAGFQQFERGCDPAFDAPEAGWGFSADVWGTGIASETVAAMVDWADGEGWPRTLAMINLANGPSIRVAEKTGFTFLRDATHRDEAVRVYERVAGAPRRP